jgi:hypothetical protein
MKRPAASTEKYRPSGSKKNSRRPPPRPAILADFSFFVPSRWPHGTLGGMAAPNPCEGQFTGGNFSRHWRKNLKYPAIIYHNECRVAAATALHHEFSSGHLFQAVPVGF